jgi:hypothetical protein
LICIILGGSADTFRVNVDPLDFQDENNPATFVTGFNQIESNGKHIFVVPHPDPNVIEIDAEGTFIRAIGRRGNGPGELGYHYLYAISVKGPSLWALRSDISGIHFFEKGSHLAGFRPETYQFLYGSAQSLRFAFDRDHVVLQAHPSTGFLAYVYGYGGEVIGKMGKLFRINRDYLAINPAAYSTMWERVEDGWYCLFHFRPILRKYNDRFEKVEEFFLDGPEIQVFEARFAEKKKDPKFTYPKAHFTDFKAFAGHIYLLSSGVLYQVDPKNGKTLTRTLFFGNEEVRKQQSEPRKLNMEYFAFLDDGTIVLANGVNLFGHDLWKTKLPFLTKPAVP